MKKIIVLTLSLTVMLAFTGCDRLGFGDEFDGSYTESAATKTEDMTFDMQTDASAIALMYPTADSEMDNGCAGTDDEVIWNFVWAPAEGATEYHLMVENAQFKVPIADVDGITASNHTERMKDAHFTDLEGWSWKLRAKVDDKWQEWSKSVSFKLKAIADDCESAKTDAGAGSGVGSGGLAGTGNGAPTSLPDFGKFPMPDGLVYEGKIPVEMFCPECPFVIRDGAYEWVSNPNPEEQTTNPGEEVMNVDDLDIVLQYVQNQRTAGGVNPVQMTRAQSQMLGVLIMISNPDGEKTGEETLDAVEDQLNKGMKLLGAQQQ